MFAKTIYCDNFFDINDKIHVLSNEIHTAKREFCERFSNLPIQKDYLKSVCNCVFDKMRDKRLHYHTPIHVLAMMDFAEKEGLKLETYEILAILFHDVIYDAFPKIAGDNEFRSAEFMDILLRGHIDSMVLRDAYDTILATSCHLESKKISAFEKLAGRVMDLDLSNFVCGESLKKVYDDAIAAEYLPYISAKKYESGRKDFLNKLLNKGFIYRTSYFKDKYEQLAVQNIKDKIK